MNPVLESRLSFDPIKLPNEGSVFEFCRLF